MLNLLVYIVFIFSAAFASAGVVLAARLRNRYRSEFFSTLLYHQVFIFTFGFYGIWGQIVIKTFLSELVTTQLLERFTDISLLLGLPFLVFAWLMLVKFSREISGRPKSNWFIFLFILLNFLVVFVFGFLITRESGIKPAILFRYYFIGLHFLYTATAALLMLFTGKFRSSLHKYESRIVSFSMVIIMIIQCTVLMLYDDGFITGLIFIFLFFAGSSFVPLYFSYGTVLSLFISEPGKEISFEEFCRRFEISPRESDIIREICNGLSNKEISEKLFISLQTVKDHTHRIYIKTNVKSRVQLINLVMDIRDK